MSNSKRKRKSEETNLVRVVVEKNISDAAGNDYKSESLLSLSGVYQPKKEMKDSKIPIALTTFLSVNPQIKTIVLHLDNDKVGRLCTATLKELLQKDYKIVDEPPPVGKDFNDFLLSYLGIARPKPARERSDAR